MQGDVIRHAQQQLANILEIYLSTEQIQQVLAACNFANHAHNGVIRKSGEPYILHPIAVACILGNMRLDADSLMAALLHDVIEDTDISKDEICCQFGITVAELVDGVTKLTISKDKQDNKAASFRKILLATLHDPRVIIIKLADRLHNMSTLEALRPEKRQRVAKETFDIFLPMARLVGMNDIADQLELLCYENLDPALFTRIQAALQSTRTQRSTYQKIWAERLERTIKTLGLQGTLEEKDNNIQLFQRFFKNKTDLNSLIHYHAFDIVLDTVAACDQLSDYLQQHFHVLQLEDHIRNPLPGGHQALTMTMRGEVTTLDLTLQTPRMREAARLGVVLGDAAPQASRSAIQASLTNLSELIDRDCAKTTLSSLLDYLHREKILVSTPDGDVHELPRGATAVDFAYAASLFLGNHAIGAKIDGNVKPLSTPLASGQVVEVITDVLATPNPEWLSFVNTPKARRSIQNILRDQDIDEQRMVGEQALNRALKLYNHGIRDLSTQDWENLLNWRHVQNKEQLFEQIALGDLLPQLVASRLYADQCHQHPEQSDQLIRGTEGIEVRYANCCTPILDDPIRGHLTRRGLIVHRARCSNLLHEGQQHPENIIPLNWQRNPEEEARFPAYLYIDKKLDAEQTTEVIYTIRQFQAGLEQLTRDHDKTYLSLIVRDRDHLAKLIRELRILLDFPSLTRLGSSFVAREQTVKQDSLA
ncbi:RelA/SpoT family protein [Alkanindiges sp. WGS2144]|uniref:RelA/SpoT family protein n=1 Tax=Alkanindiges sp. WGS2144 TaxID=3366808 RepID=UPI0037500297